jgi:anti-anti-sigma regulatory factor
MSVKTDTKEKFTVITPNEAVLTVNMAEELDKLLLPYLQKDIPHIVLNMQNVTETETGAEEKVALLQHKFYEKHYSFVICCLQQAVEERFDEMELLEMMNCTPTESEAWDIVQMEEIERELFGDE